MLMVKTTAYDVLGCNQRDSLDKIKSSYRKLALIHHPDKTKGNSSKFIEINRAYSSIIRRQQCRMVFLNQMQNFFYFVHVLMKVKVLYLTIQTDLQDIYSGTIKKIRYMRICRSGVKERQVIYVDLKNFESNTFYFKNFGDYNQLTSTFGDLEVKVVVKNDLEARIEENSFNILRERNVSLYEYMYGASFTIKHFDESIEVNEYMCIEQGDLLEFEGRGLPYIDNEGKFKRGKLKLQIRLIINTEKVKDPRMKYMIHENFNGW